MSITPGAGYMVDPKNPNGVIPIGSGATTNNPNAGLIATGTPTKTPSPATTPVIPAPSTTPPSNTVPPPSNIGSTGSSAGNNTFSGLVDQEANTAVKGSPVAAAAGQGALSVGNNQAAYESAKADYQKAVDDYNSLQSKVAEQYANTSSQSIPLEFQQGQQQVLAKQYASQLDAAQQKVTEMSNVLNAGIAEQGAQTSAYSTAGNIGQSAQNSAQSGLSTAISASAPTGNFPWSYNPQTGQFTNASTGASVSSGFTGNYGSDTSSMASAIMNGKIGYQDAESALSGYYGNTADANLTSAIVAAGGNPTLLKAKATGQSQNTTAVTTAPVNAQLGVYNQQIAALGTSQVAAQQIGAFGDQLIATMSAPPEQGGLGINPYSSQYVNQSLNALHTQFSDPKYATFNTNIAGLQARVSALLSTGEIPTAATAGAQAIVSGNATLKSMQATLQQIQAEAGAITGAQANVASTAYQGAQSAAGTNSSNSASTSVGGFKLVNGKWVPN